MQESKSMLHFGVLLLSLWIAAPAWSSQAEPPSRVTPTPRPEITTDNTRQIVVTGGTLTTRIAFMHAAAELRTGVLTGLNQPSLRYPTTRPILLFLTPTARKSAVPQIQSIEDPGGLKLQINLAPDLEPSSPLFKRTVVEALLMELVLRNQPLASADSKPLIPRWIVDALLHRIDHPNLFLAIDSLQPLLDSGKIPPLGQIMSRAEKDPTPSSPVDESIARCLLAFLMGQPEARSGIPYLLTQPSDEISALSSVLKRFPSLGSSEADLQRRWALHVASLGTQRDRVILTGPQTLKELNHLLELDLIDPNGTLSAYNIEQFSDYLRHDGIRTILASRYLELLSLLGRGHFYYSEAIKTYAEVCRDLAEGRTQGQAGKLKKAAKMRDETTAKLERIHDYLNWFEAEKAPGQSSKMQEIYRMWEETEPVPKNPYISKALDELEERLRKESEAADVERALRESRARSNSQR